MKVIIFEIYQFAELLFIHLNKNEKYEIAAFCVDSQYRKLVFFVGNQLLSLKYWKNSISQKSIACSFVLALTK